MNTILWRSEQHIHHCWSHWRVRSVSALVWLALVVESLCCCSTFLYSKSVEKQHENVNLETFIWDIQVLLVRSLKGCSFQVYNRINGMNCPNLLNEQINHALLTSLMASWVALTCLISGVSYTEWTLSFSFSYRARYSRWKNKTSIKYNTVFLLFI